VRQRDIAFRKQDRGMRNCRRLSKSGHYGEADPLPAGLLMRQSVALSHEDAGAAMP